MQFRVKYKFEADGEIQEGIESEASWFLIDQQGNFYNYEPMGPIHPVSEEYTELIPLIKIGDKWLSVEEVQAEIDRLKPIEEVYRKWEARGYDRVAEGFGDYYEELTELAEDAWQAIKQTME